MGRMTDSPSSPIQWTWACRHGTGPKGMYLESLDAIYTAKKGFPSHHGTKGKSVFMLNL